MNQSHFGDSTETENCITNLNDQEQSLKPNLLEMDAWQQERNVSTWQLRQTGFHVTKQSCLSSGSQGWQK